MAMSYAPEFRTCMTAPYACTIAGFNSTTLMCPSVVCGRMVYHPNLFVISYMVMHA